jgi:hypothetical protein
MHAAFAAKLAVRMLKPPARDLSLPQGSLIDDRTVENVKEYTAAMSGASDASPKRSNTASSASTRG